MDAMMVTIANWRDKVKAKLDVEVFMTAIVCRRPASRV